MDFILAGGAKRSRRADQTVSQTVRRLRKGFSRSLNNKEGEREKMFSRESIKGKKRSKYELIYKKDQQRRSSESISNSKWRVMSFMRWRF